MMSPVKDALFFFFPKVFDSAVFGYFRYSLTVSRDIQEFLLQTVKYSIKILFHTVQLITLKQELK